MFCQLVVPEIISLPKLAHSYTNQYTWWIISPDLGNDIKIWNVGLKTNQKK